MEIEKEVLDKVDSDDEETKDSVVTDIVEVNDLISKENKFLYVGSIGSGSAFLKSVFYKRLRENKGLKTKFMTKNSDFPTRAKKLIGEIFQFTEESGAVSCALILKSDFTETSYIKVFEYIEKHLLFQHIAVFDSVNLKEYIDLFKFRLILNNESNRDNFKNSLCTIRNNSQNQMNLLIRGRAYPNPNSIGGFSAHITTWADFKKIPCVCYVAVSDYYEISLDTIKIFYPTGASYPEIRGKLENDYLKTNNINLKTSVFQEFNEVKNMLYA